MHTYLCVYTHRCMYDYMYTYAHARALVQLSSAVAPGVNKEFVIFGFNGEQVRSCRRRLAFAWSCRRRLALNREPLMLQSVTDGLVEGCVRN